MKKKNPAKNMMSGTRLKNLLDEKRVTRKEIIIEMNKKGFTSFTDKKMSDYINGRRPIPTDLAIAISNYLDVDSRFLLLDNVIGSFIPQNPIMKASSDDQSTAEMPFDVKYEDFSKGLVLDNAVNDPSYKVNEQLFKSLGFNFGVHDDGTYEIFTPKFSLRISKEALNKLIKEIKKTGSDLIRSYKKEGDAIG